MLLTLGTEAPGYSSASIKVWDTVRVLATLPTATSPSSALTQPMSVSATAATSASVSSAVRPPTAMGSTAVQPLRVCKVFGPKLPEGEITALAVHEGVPPSSTAASSTATSGTAGSTASAPLTVAVGLASGLVYVLTLDAPLPANWSTSAIRGGSTQQGLLSSGLGAGGTTAVAAAAATSAVQAKAPMAVFKLWARPESGDACAVLGLALVAEADGGVGQLGGGGSQVGPLCGWANFL